MSTEMEEDAENAFSAVHGKDLPACRLSSDMKEDAKKAYAENSVDTTAFSAVLGKELPACRLTTDKEEDEQKKALGILSCILILTWREDDVKSGQERRRAKNIIFPNIFFVSPPNPLRADLAIVDLVRILCGPCAAGGKILDVFLGSRCPRPHRP